MNRFNEVPIRKQQLFDIPTQGDIDILLGQNSVDLLAWKVDPADFGFDPSSLSPDLAIPKVN